MPQFTYADRKLIEAEQTLWNAMEIVDSLRNTCGAWEKEVSALSNTIANIAGQMREYNNQFETED